MKKVTVYSTVGKKAIILENLEATDWAGLKSALREMNIQYSGMKAVVGETRLTLESDKATLPDNDFSLFLMPVKTKSGADRKALMEAYKANDAAQVSFKSRGLQITRMKTDDIEKELAKLGVGGIVESVKKQAEKAEEKAEEVDYDKLIEEKKAEIDAAMKAGNYAVIADLGKELTEIETAKNIAAEEKKKAEEKRKKEAEEAARKAENQIVDKLDKQARDIARDFSDVKRF